MPDPRKLADGPTPAGNVDILDFNYQLGDLSLTGTGGLPPVVQQGQSLSFRNGDDDRRVYHSITSCKAPCNRSTGIAYPIADGPVQFESGTLGSEAPSTTGSGALEWQTPNNLDAGTYTYFCRIHPFMRGAFRQEVAVSNTHKSRRAQLPSRSRPSSRRPSRAHGPRGGARDEAERIRTEADRDSTGPARPRAPERARPTSWSAASTNSSAASAKPLRVCGRPRELRQEPVVEAPDELDDELIAAVPRAPEQGVQPEGARVIALKMALDGSSGRRRRVISARTSTSVSRTRCSMRSTPRRALARAC